MTKTVKDSDKDLIIEALRAENLELKLKLLEKRKDLPTDDSTRRSYFNEFIHNEKNNVKKDLQTG